MDAFIEYLKNTKNKAENTLVAYRRDLKAFEVFLEGRNGRVLVPQPGAEAGELA